MEEEASDEMEVAEEENAKDDETEEKAEELKPHFISRLTFAGVAKPGQRRQTQDLLP